MAWLSCGDRPCWLSSAHTGGTEGAAGLAGLLGSLGSLETLKLCSNLLVSGSAGGCGLTAAELKEDGNTAFGEKRFEGAAATYAVALAATGDPGPCSCRPLSVRSKPLVFAYSCRRAEVHAALEPGGGAAAARAAAGRGGAGRLR